MSAFTFRHKYPSIRSESAIWNYLHWLLDPYLLDSTPFRFQTQNVGFRILSFTVRPLTAGFHTFPNPNSEWWVSDFVIPQIILKKAKQQLFIKWPPTMALQTHLKPFDVNSIRPTNLFTTPFFDHQVSHKISTNKIKSSESTLYVLPILSVFSFLSFFFCPCCSWPL